METILSRLRTVHKTGTLALAPSFQQGRFDSHAVDAPFLAAWPAHPRP